MILLKKSQIELTYLMKIQEFIDFFYLKQFILKKEYKLMFMKSFNLNK